MNNETNLATQTNNMTDDRLGAEARPNEKMIVFAPKGQVPVQLEHWLRKRQIGVTFSEATKVDATEIKNSGARYALLDLDSQGGGDAALIRQLHSELPQVKLVVTTSSPDEGFVNSLIEAGSAGVVVKRPYVADLVLAVQAAGEGRSYISGVPSAKDGSQVQITARERQVLELMAHGYSNQAIGEKLNISVKTVEAHRARLFKKLGASNVADAVLLAIRVGLVTP
jgi:DNA-binding NarL/FixJ family response regulator